MRYKEAVWLAAIIIVFGSLAIILYNFAKPKQSGKTYQPVLPEDVELAMEGVSRITSTQHGKILWTIKNDGLLYMENVLQVRINHPEAIVPIKDGGTVEVKGNDGTFYRTTENFSLNEDIEIKMGRNGKLEWLIHSDTADYYRKADKFDINNFHGTLYPQDGGTVEVRGERGEYLNKTDNFILSENVKIKMDRNKRTEWIMRGDTGEYFKKDETFTILNIEGVVYPESGGTVDVKGNKGIYHDHDKTMDLSGDVICKMGDGTKIMTDNLNFNIEQNTAFTDSEVKISGKGFKLSGKGMHAQTQAKKIELKKQVKLVLDKGFGALK
jgi:LPS export ABC transporter protein LptC